MEYTYQVRSMDHQIWSNLKTQVKTGEKNFTLGSHVAEDYVEANSFSLENK